MQNFKNSFSLFAAVLLLLTINAPVNAKDVKEGELTEAQQRKEKFKNEAVQAHKEIVDAYLQSEFKKLNDIIKKYDKYHIYYSPQARKDLMYIKKAVKKHRPKWWKKCDNSKPVTFKAEIWNKKFTANYIPSTELGFQAAAIRKGKLVFFVTWQPYLLGSSKVFKSKFGQEYGFKKGDLAEGIVWHELGHNYVNVCLPDRHVLKLYIQHRQLFSHLQEFYADMTSIYHASPQARKLAMMMRLPSLSDYHNGEPHTRAAHAIGAVLLSKFIENPKKWPSVNFPEKVPDEDVELNTIIHIYKNLGPKWTMQEDREIQNFVKKYLKQYGDKALRSKGKINLPNKQKFHLLAIRDTKTQKKRDKWVAQKLKKIIDSGRTQNKKTAISAKEINAMFGEVIRRK